jgi:hypothetical protein
MGLLASLRFGLAERKIRCRNCGKILHSTEAKFCTQECIDDYYAPMTAEEWQAHG